MDQAPTPEPAEGSGKDSSDSCGGGFCHAITTCPTKVVTMIFSPFLYHDEPALSSSRDPIATAAAGFTLPRGGDDTSNDIPSISTNKSVPPPSPFKGLQRPRKNVVSPYTPQTTNYKHHELRDESDDYNHDDDDTHPRLGTYRDNPIVLNMGPPRDEDGNVLHDISI